MDWEKPIEWSVDLLKFAQKFAFIFETVHHYSLFFFIYDFFRIKMTFWRLTQFNGYIEQWKGGEKCMWRTQNMELAIETECVKPNKIAFISICAPELNIGCCCCWFRLWYFFQLHLNYNNGLYAHTYKLIHIFLWDVFSVQNNFSFLLCFSISITFLLLVLLLFIFFYFLFFSVCAPYSFQILHCFMCIVRVPITSFDTFVCAAFFPCFSREYVGCVWA